MHAVWFNTVQLTHAPGTTRRYTCYQATPDQATARCGGGSNYRSTDGGESWQYLGAPAYAGLPETMSGRKVAICPKSGRLHLINYAGNYSLRAEPK